MTAIAAKQAPATVARTRWGLVSLLTTGHFANDFYAVYLVALLPNLTDRFHLNGVEQGLLGAVLSVAGSVSQPFAGWVGDRIHRHATIVVGLALSVFLSCLMTLPAIWMVYVLLILGGIGVSLYHPNAGLLAAEASGGRRGLGMAVFVNGGALGVFAAPMLIRLPVVQHHLWTLPYWMAFGFLVALLLAVAPLHGIEKRVGAPRFRDLLGRAHLPLHILVAVGTLRAVTQGGFTTFLLFHARHQKWAEGAGGRLLGMFLLAVAVGGMTGGVISDRVGRKAVIIVSSIVGGALLVFAPQATPALTALPLILGGFIFGGSTPVCVVMAQETAPNHASAATGLLSGFAWGIGALLLPAVGALKDAADPATALRVVAGTSCLAGILALALWETHRVAAKAAGR